MVIDVAGFRREFIPVHLFLPVAVSGVELDPVYLKETDPGDVRFLFGGDTHFGRRYIDPTEITPRDQLPPDNKTALIRVSDPGPGTREVLRYVRPFFQEADFTSVNLESPVTMNVSTPHLTKDYVLMTLPGSLPALQWAGISYVSLGNNHVYDYREQGLSDTISSLQAAGIANSGAGPNATEAFKAYRVVLNGTPYAILAMNSIDGIEHPINYVADDRKGGSANLKDTTMVTSAIERELDEGFVPIIQVHGGDEYVYEPPDYISGRLDLVTDTGAGLVVSEHSHIAEGVGIRNGVVVVEGLGNLAFDAERHETMLGLLARVDMNGKEVRSVRLIPVYIGNFTPRPVSGGVADILLRRVGEFSKDSPYPVYPYNGQGWVALGENQVTSNKRTARVNITIPESGSTVLDLRQLAQSSESLAGVKDNVTGSKAQLGRDLMIYGDFEDWNVDETVGVADQWDTSAGSVELAVTQPYRGTQNLMSVRQFGNTEDSVIPFRNRIRVMGDARNQVPNKNLTFIGYIRGRDAGPVKIISKYLASEDPVDGGPGMTFGEEEIVVLPGGTFPWQQYLADIHMPPDDPGVPRNPVTDPRALQIFIHHLPSVKTTSIAEFDDLAIISWEETVNSSKGATLRTPHARDFLRVTGTPGTHQVTLAFESYTPVFGESST
jgi:poly-gamma-glutamate capsule biosynthesis protein CapA/YwtB (metallophosphatase superfamily)